MDRGPLRTRQQATNYGNNESKPEQVSRQGTADDAVYDDAPAQSRRRRSIAPEAPKKRLPIIIGAVVSLVLLLGAGWWFTSGGFVDSGIDSSKYQAVFFDNGQVYFGKLKGVNSEYMQLTEIYYLQNDSTETGASQDPQSSSTAAGDVQLVKLGDEIHGPEDKMIISREKIQFYENLKSDSKVSTTIKNYQASR